MYRNRSITRYLDDLAAKLPAPGGGSAAALTAALGASLISMVVNFTIGRPKYAQYENELKSVLGKSEAARREFLKLVDLDVIAYKSKDLKASLAVPLQVCRLCAETAKVCLPLIKKGNANLASDVSVAAILLESAFFSALCNVDINLKYMESPEARQSYFALIKERRGMNDKKLTVQLRKELERKGKIIKSIRLKTEAGVGKLIRG